MVTRAVLGSIFGTIVTFLLLLVGPQTIQRTIAINGNGWPAAILLSGLAAYLAGFVGNRLRPRMWAAIWLGGWLIGVLLMVAVVAVFGSGD